MISPESSAFAALSGASSFAARIIEKYSVTDIFPFSDEALVFLKNVREATGEEKKVNENVNYTLKLTLIRKLIVDGKISDPTVNRVFIPFVSKQIEQNLTYLRQTEFKAYKDVTKALNIINSTENIDESIVSFDAPDGYQTFRYSSLDFKKLSQSITENSAENTFLTESYAYNTLPSIVFRKEKIADIPELMTGIRTAGKGEETAAEGVTVNAENETVINVGGDAEYRYENESLTFKNEGDSVDNTEVTSEITNAAPSVTNIEHSAEGAVNVTENAEHIVNAESVESVTVNAESENVINVGDTEYRYENEALTFKNESSVSQENQTENSFGNYEINNVSAPEITSVTENVSQSVSSTDNEINQYGDERLVDVKNVGFMSMNSFMSSGSAYIYDINNKYIHKRIKLTSAESEEAQAGDAFQTLLSEPRTAFLTLNRSINMLTSGGELSPYEQVIFDTSVRRVFRKYYTREGAVNTKEMLRRMDSPRRTEVLSRVIKWLSEVPFADASALGSTQTKLSEKETELVTMLTEKMSPQTIKIIEKSAKAGTISSQLFRLYSDEIITENESTKYIPALMKYLIPASYNYSYNGKAATGAFPTASRNAPPKYESAASQSVRYGDNYYNPAQSLTPDSAPMNNYSVNTTVRTYALPLILRNEKSESNTETYFNLTLPEKRHSEVVSALRSLTKTVMHSGSSKSDTAYADANNVYLSSHSESSPFADYNANYYYDVGSNVELHYREPAPQTDYSANSYASEQNGRPDMDELVKKFGNLIEGADAGLTPSFNVGSRGISDAMAAIEQTAEKVAANTKLIEEIREKQSELETDTLKSSDIDSLSEEMIKRLRTRLRYDKSRFPH